MDGLDRIDNVFRPQTSRDDHRDADAFDDFPVQLPIVRSAQSTDLPVACPVAVEKQNVGDTIITLCNPDTALIKHGDAPHEHQGRKLLLEHRRIVRREKLGRSAEMQDVRIKFRDHPSDEGEVIGQAQR